MLIVMEEDISPEADMSVTVLSRGTSDNPSKLVNGEGDFSRRTLDDSSTPHEDTSFTYDTPDHLVQLILELKFQNDYFKSQFVSFRSQYPGSLSNGECEDGVRETSISEDSKELQEQVILLKNKVQEQKEMQDAAEEALKHLRQACSEADSKVNELSAKLSEVQQSKEKEIQERDEKYTELDSKFGRLLKRAKQRIQEVQKEKDDLEENQRELNEKAAKASSRYESVHQELERNRQSASEALRAMDVERQQLRASNNKLRDSLEDMRQMLEAKETALEGVQQSLLEKEQMLHDAQVLVSSVEEKRQGSIVELNAKHQKIRESLEAQLSDALTDRAKAAETVSSLQEIIAAKESEIAELEAASTGEVVRLGAALEAAKNEVIQLKNEQENQRETWESSYQALKAKLEESASSYMHSEIEAEKIKSKYELDLAKLNQQVNEKDSELSSLKEKLNISEQEFSSYKIRAHALLQKKDAEMAAAKDIELVKSLESTIKEAEREITVALSERDQALQAFEDTRNNLINEISERDMALSVAEKRISDLEATLSSTKAFFASEREAWQKNLDSVQETWQSKFVTLEAQVDDKSEQKLKEELKVIRRQYQQLKIEYDSFRDMADKVTDAKDKEIARLSENVNGLQQSLKSKSMAESRDTQNTGSSRKEDHGIFSSTAEQQILLLARQQAQREEELAQSQRHIMALQEEIEELEHENRLHQQQETVLKDELRNMERSQKREGVDMTYLKNVVLKLLETGEVEALLPVVGTLLQFSSDEMKKCQNAYRDVPLANAAAVVDAAASAPRSLFSRFSFS